MGSMKDRLTSEELNALTKDVARVFQRHGIDCRANEHHNALRGHLVDSLREWFGVEVPNDYAAPHTIWHPKPKPFFSFLRRNHG